MTYWLRISSIILGASFAILTQVGVAAGAELKILTPRSMWTILNEIGPQFEASSGYKLNVVTDIAANLEDRILQGETFDIFVGPPAQMNRLVQNKHVLAETGTAIAHSGIGVEVRAGAPKPDISSVEAFKSALLNAKSIAYLKQDGTSGAYLHALFERLGIADAIKSKVVRPETDIVSELVAKGEVELGMVVITQIMTTPRGRACWTDTKRNPILRPMEWRGERKVPCAAGRKRLAQLPDRTHSPARAQGARNGTGISEKYGVRWQIARPRPRPA